jgi:hypothetical protein
MIRGIIPFCICVAIYNHSELLIVLYFHQTTQLVLKSFIILRATVTEFEKRFKMLKKNGMLDS